MTALAIDCEMVGAGRRGSRRDLAAKVSIVNELGQCVYNTYVKQNFKVTNYRTAISGVTPELLAGGRPFKTVRKEVAKMIRGCILVGHGLDKDLKVLSLCHPEWNQRDTAEYWRFRTGRGRPALRKLAANHLGMSIQNGAHDPCEDALAAMRLYKKYETEWENWLNEQSDEVQSEEEQLTYYYPSSSSSSSSDDY